MRRKQFLTTTAAGVAAAAAPRFTTAAGPVTVRIGFLDSFAGVFSDLGAYHRIGAEIALADANRKGRVKYEFVFGDDASAPATAGTEARRLISQEKVDALLGGTSSATGLALAALTNELGVFNLLIGPQDTAITGGKATHSTYRFGPNVRMLVNAMSRRVLALGKKWYFIQADYALGRDAYAQLSDVLKRAGGSEVGHDIVKLGTSDFSAELTKLRNSDADVLVLANSGLDAANTAKQFVQFGLNKKIKLAGISLEDIYYKALPLDQIVGATFPVLWAPSVSDSAQKLARRMAGDVGNVPVSGRHYLGYMAMATLADRIEAAGTTRADAIAKAFDNHSFMAYKENNSLWKGCDHQCAQDTYAGSTISSKQFDRTKFMYDVVGTVPAGESDGSGCDTAWAKAAQTAIASAPLGTRAGYTPKTV